MTRSDSSIRPSCILCVYKHLSNVIVLAGEYLSQDPDGYRPYRDHLLYMTGHLSQAEEQSVQEYPEMSQKIREVRKRIETAKAEGMPPSTHVPTIEDISEILMLGGMGLDGLPLEEEEEDEIEGDLTEMRYDPPIMGIDELSMAEVGYTTGATGNYCQDCDYWTGFLPDSTVSGSCAIVAGRVFKKGTCTHFEDKKK